MFTHTILKLLGTKCSSEIIKFSGLQNALHRNLGFYTIVSKTENVEEAGAADASSRAAPFMTGLQSGTHRRFLKKWFC